MKHGFHVGQRLRLRKHDVRVAVVCDVREEQLGIRGPIVDCLKRGEILNINRLPFYVKRKGRQYAELEAFAPRMLK